MDLSNCENSAQQEKVLSLITEELETLVGATKLRRICSKYKAITAFVPYAVWQGRDGQHKTLDAFLRAVRASKGFGFMWHHIRLLIPALLNEESHVSLKQVAVLVSPHLPWRDLLTSEHLIQLLGAAASAIPYTDEVGMSVVDTLLHIAAYHPLQSHIPVGMWSWLNKRPSLPLVCWGRHLAGLSDVLRIVRALRDFETLKSLLLLVWSEWNDLNLGHLVEVRILIQEDLKEIEMWHHREDLFQHLDHLLGQLNLGLEPLRQHDPDINENDIRRRWIQYTTIRAVLLEKDGRATDMLIRERLRLAILCCLLIPIDRYKVPLDVYVCNASPVSIAVYSGYPPPPSTHNYTCQSTSNP